MTIPISRRAALSGCALALLLATPLLSAEQAGYYRWKDDKGQFQATQQPPADRPSEYVKLSTGKSMPPSEPESGGNGTGQTEGAKPNVAKGPIEGLPDRDPEKCKQARDTQAVLDSHARIRTKDDKGEYRYLSADEINEQKQLAKDSADIYCEPAP